MKEIKKNPKLDNNKQRENNFDTDKEKQKQRQRKTERVKREGGTDRDIEKDVLREIILKGRKRQTESN